MNFAKLVKINFEKNFLIYSQNVFRQSLLVLGKERMAFENQSLFIFSRSKFICQIKKREILTFTLSTVYVIGTFFTTNSVPFGSITFYSSLFNFEKQLVQKFW